MYAEEGGGVVGVVCNDAEFCRRLVGEAESAERVGWKVVFNDAVGVGFYDACAGKRPTI